MKFTYAIVIVGSAALASAQDFSAIPQCAQSCIVTAVGSGTCRPTDVACLCGNSAIIQSITSCVSTACPASQVSSVIQAAQGICSGVVSVSSALASASSAVASITETVGSQISSAVASVSSAVSEASASGPSETRRPENATGSITQTVTASRSGTITRTGSSTVSQTGSASSEASSSSSTTSTPNIAAREAISGGLVAMAAFGALVMAL